VELTETSCLIPIPLNFSGTQEARSKGKEKATD